MKDNYPISSFSGNWKREK